MDIQRLATETTVILAPYLPYFVLAGEAAIKEVGKKFGESLSSKVESIWKQLKESFGANKKFNSVSMALATDPDDHDLRVVLARLLAEQIRNSPELASELQNFLQSDMSIQKVLVEHGSEVQDIYQRMTTPGRQEITIQDSQSGNISQEQ